MHRSETPTRDRRAEPDLRGIRVLVVEDEYLLANDIARALTDTGATVVGPVGRMERAEALIAGTGRIDAAVLDVNLDGAMIFPVADALEARGIPFAFATGYDRWALPERFARALRMEKPVDAGSIVAAIRRLLDGPPAAG